MNHGTRLSVPAVDRRRGPEDRRRSPRGGRRLSDAARVGLLAAVCALFVPQMAAAQQVKFGFDATAAKRARDLGMPVSYGSLWVGSWTQKWGWDGIRQQLEAAKAAGVTPVVQWWYWGDDIGVACVENGCQDRYQGVWKDKATWYRMSNELADVIVSVMGPGSDTLVIVESEFNKSGIEHYEAFDGYLVDHFHIFRQRGLRTVLTFGNWGQVYWTNFDRAVAAADLLGAMALQSSVRDASTYLSGAEMLLNAARYYQATFKKPTFVTDFAFSSYPEPSYELYQDTVVRDIFRRMNEFRAAGVQGMVWRMLADDPAFNTANYHGMAERFWGLVHADGTKKAAFLPFLNGMLAEAQLSVTAPTTSEAPAPEPDPAPAPESTVEPAPAPAPAPAPVTRKPKKR